MTNKITLITPPDIYENSNKSLLFCNLSSADQEIASKWLAERNLTENLNFYIFSGEINVAWLLHSLGVCEYKFLDLDNSNEVSSAMHGYLLSKNGVFYKTEDENLAAIYTHINVNRLSNIIQFLEKVFSE